MEEVKRVMKYSSLSSYMLKPTSLIIQLFKENKKEQENISKHMCNFGAWGEWRNGRIYVSSYLDFDISNDKYRLVNPTPLDCIIGYIMEYSVGDRDLKRLPQWRLDLIDGSISSYGYIIKSTGWLHIIKQANKFASTLCDIESYRIGSKQDRKKITMEAKDHRKKKCGHKHTRNDDGRLKGLETC